MSASAPRDFLTAHPFTHRGLHGAGTPENSLAAFRGAIAIGFGIECDVRLSSDGIAHVFHDSRLARLTGQTGRVRAMASTSLAALRLSGSEEPVPGLAALLALAGTTTPLLIELKSDEGAQGCARLCDAVARLLDAHPGARAAVMSFDPLACHWFARHRPDIVRGLVMGRRHRTGIVARRGTALAISRACPISSPVTCVISPGPDPFPGGLACRCCAGRYGANATACARAMPTRSSSRRHAE